MSALATHRHLGVPGAPYKVVNTARFKKNFFNSARPTRGYVLIGSQVLYLRKVCCRIMEDSVLNPGNCVPVYCSARNFGIEQLEAKALYAMKTFFSEIIANFPTQIRLLSEEWILELAASDDLQVITSSVHLTPTLHDRPIHVQRNSIGSVLFRV